MLPIDLRVLVIYVLRAYFLSTSAVVLIARAIPQLRTAFIPYGKTYNGSPNKATILQRLSDITVPKSWFWHFYLLSTTLSIFWVMQFISCANRSQLCISEWLQLVNGRALMCWMLMFVHGCRRLFETIFVQKASSARMWIGHYLVGCAFYFMMSITVFAEGLDRPDGTLRAGRLLMLGLTLRQSLFKSIDRRTISAIALFITASTWQYSTHSILASLRPVEKARTTYLPPPTSSLSFQLFLTPHYTAEILIYLAMALLLRNGTILCALVWVITNLSVSAGETRVWVNNKFRGHEWGRWNLIPFMY